MHDFIKDIENIAATALAGHIPDSFRHVVESYVAQGSINAKESTVWVSINPASANPSGRCGDMTNTAAIGILMRKIGRIDDADKQAFFALISELSATIRGAGEVIYSIPDINCIQADFEVVR